MEVDREDELQQDVEAGRKAKIALEVLREFLTERRNHMVRLIEDGTYSYGKDSEVLRDALAEMRIMRSFMNEAEYYIQRGKFAEEEMSYGN